MRVVIIGCGYVGLVAGACLADCGHDITCVDADAGKIAALHKGCVPIFEPGLDQLLAANKKAGRLHFTTDLPAALANADVVFICVGTPSLGDGGEIDLSAIHAVAAQLAPALSGHTVIAVKSTVPMGTGDAIERLIRQINPQADFCVVSNPEFLREGSAIADFQRPDRIVIGLEDQRARPIMASLYRPLVADQTPLLFMDRRSAELTKYAGNAFLAMKLAFINEIADLCEKTGANIEHVAHGLGLDPRIGAGFLNAGPGYGGSCLPKDTRALARAGRDHASELLLVEAAIKANHMRQHAMGQRIAAAMGGNVRGRTIALLGLTFKPDTADMRNAPSLAIIRTLQAEGAHLRAFDPKGMGAARSLLENIVYADNAYAAAAGAECLVLVTEWPAFRALDLSRLRAAMARPLFIDLRNLFSPREMTEAGFVYRSIGRPV